MTEEGSIPQELIESLDSPVIKDQLKKWKKEAAEAIAVIKSLCDDGTTSLHLSLCRILNNINL